MKMPDTAMQTRAGKTDIPHREFGIIIWLLIGVLALLLIGLFLWYRSLETQTVRAPLDATRPSAAENQEPESRNAVVDVDTFRTMSNSDELKTIDADLESTRLDSLAAEQTAIENELGL